MSSPEKMPPNSDSFADDFVKRYPNADALADENPAIKKALDRRQGVNKDSSAPDLWEARRVSMDKAIADERALLDGGTLSAEEALESQLRIKVFESQRDLVVARDQRAFDNFDKAINKDEEFLEIVPEDVIYFDDGEGLRVVGIDKDKQVLLVTELDGTSRDSVVEMPFQDLIAGADSVARIDKLHHQKKLEVSDSELSSTGLIETDKGMAAKRAEPQVRTGQDRVIDSEFEPVAPPARLESPQKKIGYEAPEVESRSGPQGPRPQWKVTGEPVPRTREDYERIEKRKAWLGAMFAAGEDALDLGISKRGLVNTMRTRLQKPTTPGMPTMLDKHLGNNKTALAAAGLLDRLDKEKVSLRDLFGQAKTFQDFRALKILGAALLEGALNADGQKPWAAMNEQQKSLVRLGELIGLEAERRQIELSGGKMEKDVAARAYKRYVAVAESADIPNFFYERFTHTAENLQERYRLPKIERREARPAQDVADLPERAPMRTAETPTYEVADSIIGEARAEVRIDDMSALQLERYVDTLRQKKEELAVISPAVREFEQGLHEDQFDYPASLLDQLKLAHRSQGGKNDEYRQNFIDSLSEQMRYCQFQNNNPSRWDRLTRGIIDGIGARWQVFGWRSIFSPRQTARELQGIRQEVSKSFSALTATKIDKNFLAYHVAEFGLANANEQLVVKQKGLAKADAAIAGYYKRPQSQAGESSPLPRHVVAAQQAEQAINAYYAGGETVGSVPPAETADETRQRLERQLQEDAQRNRQAMEERGAQKRTEAEAERRARSQEARQQLEFKGLQSSIRTWLINGSPRELLRWKTNNVDRLPAWRRYVDTLGRTEDEVWQDAVDQFDETQRRRVA